MKRVIPVFLLCLPVFSMADPASPTDSLGVRKTNGVYYIEHRVEKGEGLHAICRRYKVSREDVLKANKGLTESLVLGQVILIPVSHQLPQGRRSTVHDTHADADSERPAEHIPTDHNKNPGSHVVKPGETLYRVSNMYGVSEGDLKKWNGLSDNSLKAGQVLRLSAPADIAPPLPSVKKDSVKSASSKSSEPHPMAGSAGIREKEESGMARWFIDDELVGGRLLALHKTAPVGTIIKVVNRVTNQSVFVRVVGVLPDTDENRNILIKISRSTAEKIGMRYEQAQVKLCYALE